MTDPTTPEANGEMQETPPEEPKESILAVTLIIALALIGLTAFAVYLSRQQGEATQTLNVRMQKHIEADIPPRLDERVLFFDRSPTLSYAVIAKLWVEIDDADLDSIYIQPSISILQLLGQTLELGADGLWWDLRTRGEAEKAFVAIKLVPIGIEAQSLDLLTTEDGTSVGDVVVQVDEGSVAEQAGLYPADIFLRIDGQPATTSAVEVSTLLSRARDKGQPYTIDVLRPPTGKEVSLTIPPAALGILHTVLPVMDIVELQRMMQQAQEEQAQEQQVPVEAPAVEPAPATP